MKMSVAERISSACTGDPEIYRIDYDIKVKTKDGMIYTMEKCSCGDYDGDISVEDAAKGEIMGNVFDWIEKVKKEPDEFWVSIDEALAVRNSEIVRVWAELGGFYTNSEYKEIHPVN